MPDLGKIAEIAVIGAGPGGLMAAEVLSAAGLAVTVYERMPSVARKLLIAGRGGLNLTHSEPFESFITRYGAAALSLRPILEAFPPRALIDWAEGLGQPTFVGSSGRVFPKAMKASPLLRAWLARLASQGVTIKTRHEWKGWDEAGRLVFMHGDATIYARPVTTVLALGGASWPKLGSTGGWAAILRDHGIAVTPLRPANVGFTADWSEPFRRFEGEPLKNIALNFAGRMARGEAMITRTGLEGGAIYALSGSIGPIIGQNYGAGNHQRMRQAFTLSLAVNAAFTCAAWIVLLLGTGLIVDFFKQTGSAAELIRLFNAMLSPLFVFLGAMFVANAAFNTLGHARLSTWINWGRATVGTIPFVEFGSRHGGAEGVLAGNMIGGIAFGVVAVWLCYRLMDRLQYDVMD